MSLRPYQQAAHDAVVEWVTKCTDPCLVAATTGAGKSHIIAEIAKTLHSVSSGRHILCIAPSAELVLQNREKFLATGNKASIFSASAGGRDLRHPVVFGTPMTIKNKIARFGGEFCAVVIDEAHGMTPTIKAIIESLREHNEYLRVIGLTATPYRLGSGYIYRLDTKNKPVNEDACRDPYFAKLVYDIQARDLIELGYLTQPVIGAIGVTGYETLDMQVNAQGKFDQSDIDKAYHGQGRKTAAIIADIVLQSQNRQGVLIFAATIQHAKECMQSLPPELSAMVDGKTPKEKRKQILKDFKSKKIKYLVNVAVLTTGFDAPHVDVVAMLRATESVGLLQQIIGRGLRISEGKSDVLILDYAENIERHCPDNDLFSPEVKASRVSSETTYMKVICPDCQTENEFKCRPNNEGFLIDEHGYFVDLNGNTIETDEGKPLPAHFGRRCQALHLAAGGQLVQCNYRWTIKVCETCSNENDIAARYCQHCKSELVDPNEKLRIEYKAKKKDPTQLQCDEVIALRYGPTVARSGRECILANFVTPHRSFPVWYSGIVPSKLAQFEAATEGGKIPKTVTYKRNPKGFYETFAFNQPADREPVKNEVSNMVKSVRGSNLPKQTVSVRGY